METTAKAVLTALRAYDLSWFTESDRTIILTVIGALKVVEDADASTEWWREARRIIALNASTIYRLLGIQV